MTHHPTKESKPTTIDVVCRNPQATRRYEIETRYEAGLVLAGSEVKSLRMKRADLDGAYAGFEGNELFIHKMHIAPYEQAKVFGHEPKQSRKLLLHFNELNKLYLKLQTRGFTLVPLSLYFKNGRAKLELGLGKGLRVGDKRQEIKRDLDRREARDAMSKGQSRR